jgi:iron-sulfur cluster assembly accessory protein
MSENSGNIVSIDGKDHRPWAVISREKLLKAAVSEIAERGYEKARLVDIAAKADLTVGSVYTWYKNKTDLFNAAIEFALTEQYKVVIDSMSMQYLQGAEIDYKEEIMGSQFVIKNPNAQSTCGCGSSFAA